MRAMETMAQVSAGKKNRDVTDTYRKDLFAVSIVKRWLKGTKNRRYVAGRVTITCVTI